jgi:guanylate kinase
VSEPRFRELKEGGEFLEHAHVHGNWYATSSTWLKQQIEAGRDVLLEIDWQGAAQVRKLIPSSVQIFILPPSLASLEERLVRRGQDDAATIARRLEAAREEMRHCGEFDYVIINQEFASAAEDLSAIVRVSRLRSDQQRVRYKALLAQML